MTATQALCEPPAAGRRRAVGRGARLGVFGDNRDRPIHRWYPFVEGFSADLVAAALDELAPGAMVLDPFGGSGTTALAAAERGYDCAFCEVNPYLAWVADVKVNRSRIAWQSGAAADLVALAEAIRSRAPRAKQRDHPLLVVDARRRYFPDGVAAQVLGALRLAEERCRPEALPLARLAVATSLIPASNMVRRTDLRRRRPGDPPPRAFGPLLAERLLEVAGDVDAAGPSLRGAAVRVGSDVRQLTAVERPVELVVTSPPYLNGTNYCRNTKLELVALGFVEAEEDLAVLRDDSIAAGINTVSSRRSEPGPMAAVEAVAAALDRVAYDRRIPAMVRMYFSDMRRTFAALRASAAGGARFLLDIGDSRFSGVHVPTHELLCDVAALEGWASVRVETIRKRRSYDGSALTQVLLELRAV